MINVVAALIENDNKSSKDYKFVSKSSKGIAKEHEKYITEYFDCPVFITYC